MKSGSGGRANKERPSHGGSEAALLTRTLEVQIKASNNNNNNTSFLKNLVEVIFLIAPVLPPPIDFLYPIFTMSSDRPDDDTAALIAANLAAF